MNVKIHIEWEHGDADSTTNEIYKFPSQEEANEFLKFLYALRTVRLSQSNTFGQSKTFWHFEDGHYQCISEHVDKINEQFNNKFVDMIPHDNHYQDHRPSINQIYVSIGNKHKTIVWNELINKKEHLISLPSIGDELTTNTGHIRGMPSPYKNIKGFVRHSDLTPILGEETGEWPKTKYPEFKTKVVDCIMEISTQYETTRFNYFILCEITDTKIIKDKNEKKYCVTQMDGYDKEYQTKFSHTYDDQFYPVDTKE